MSLGHYSMIFWLRGMAFHLVDAVLLLNLRVSETYTYKRLLAMYVQGGVLISYLKIPGSYSFIFEED